MNFIKENVPIAPLTTLRIGGRARYFVRAESEEDVIKAFEFAAQNALKIFILGGGSNILVSDEGFDGLVIQILIKGVSFENDDDEKTATALVGAGEEWDDFVAACVAGNMQGIECLSGIPGFVGGTPVQNVGAYGQEVSETIVMVRCFDRKTGTILELTNSECGFSYRKSIFNSTKKERFVVLKVKYKLNIDGSPKIVYADLQKHFDEKNPTLQETRDAVLKIRAAKSMVIDESDANSKSAGSFFKNPVVSKKVFERLQLSAKGGQLVPSFPVDDLNIKIPAAWLIEQAGFQKGYVKGNAGISTNHTLALINRGNSSAEDIVGLMTEIRLKVLEKFRIELEPEPVFVGFD